MMQIYSWGANAHGQLGLGYASELCAKPLKVSADAIDTQRLAKIAGGGNHTLFLQDDGRLFGCGWNYRGQLGIVDTVDHLNITEIPLDEFKSDRVVDIVCGWDSSAIVTHSGALYVFGSNAFGQLGWSTMSLKSTNRPRRLQLPNADDVRSVSFGLRHMTIWTRSGHVYCVGRIKFTANCTAIDWNGVQWWRLDEACGSDICLVATGQNHVLWAKQRDTDAEICGVGDNRYGQCAAISIAGRLDRLQCGWTHNAAITTDGRVSLWGRNSYGQLANALDDDKRPVLLQCGDASTVRALHLGSEHGLAIIESGDVFTWGWNEHGNCGNGTEDNVVEPEQVELYGECVLAGTGAGFCYAVMDGDS